VEKVLGGLDFELRLTQGSYPFVTQRDSRIVKQMQQSIRRVTGEETKLSTAGGTSDARFMGAFGIDVVEFGVINDRIHAPNECTSIEEVEQLYRVFRSLVEAF
jgi:succinyl-diaminopimelate desuccinylase